MSTSGVRGLKTMPEYELHSFSVAEEGIRENVDPEGAEKSIHAGQEARWYSWRMPPIRSRRMTRK